MKGETGGISSETDERAYPTSRLAAAESGKQN